MTTSAPRPIPTRPRHSIDQRRDSRAQSYPPWAQPQPQPYHPPPPGQHQPADIRRGRDVPPPSAPPQSLPPANYGMDYGPPPPQDAYSSSYAQDAYGTSPRSYATTPGAVYDSSQPAQGYAFPPQQAPPPQASSYNPPNMSQYPPSAYAQPPPQQSRLHPQDAVAPRDAYPPPDPYGRSPPKQLEPAPSARPRRGTGSSARDAYPPPPRDAYNFQGPPPAAPAGRPRRGTGPPISMENGYAKPSRGRHQRRSSYDVSNQRIDDWEQDFGPTDRRRYSISDSGVRKEGRRRSDESDKEREARAQRRQRKSSKATSIVDKPPSSFGDTVFWVKDKLKDGIKG